MKQALKIPKRQVLGGAQRGEWSAFELAGECAARSGQELMAQLVHQSQKFIVPAGAFDSVVETDDDLASLNLPYDAVAILVTAPNVIGSTESVAERRILTVAVNASSALVAGLPNSFSDPWAFCFGLEDVGGWRLRTPIRALRKQGSRTLMIGSLDGQDATGEESSFVDFWAVLGLCRWLASPRVIVRDSAAAPRSETVGEQPLWSHHTLEIDGVVVKTIVPPQHINGAPHPYRSHLRRGHHRTVAGKRVWVRPTYVHGSLPGFVDKDYQVVSGANT